MNLRAEYERLCRTESDIYLHLPYFVQTVDEVRARNVLELGTRTGVSTIAWLYALDQIGHLTSVDLDPAPPIGEHDHWTFVQADDMDYVDQVADGSVDVLFIDTSHLYEHTLAELRAYLPKVRSGGRVLLHDTMLRRPEGSPPRPLFPVRTALNEFCTETGLSWDEHRYSWGLGIIEVP